jgi:outer membrane protein assembly factor BamB
VQKWTHGAPRDSDPAWPDEAKRDEYRPGKALRPRFSFDRANHVAVVGDSVFVGSAQSHTVRALSAVDGKTLWAFFSDGPVRMAPTVAGGHVFFGSDDGSAYCLDAQTGALVWKHTPAGTANKLIPNDGRFISPWAVRTGVAVESGVAYFGAGLFPHEGVFLCALDAATGEVRSSSHWTKRLDNQASLQGALLLAQDRVIVPGGRSTPWAFNRATGDVLGQFNDKRSGMGAFAVLAGNTLLHGPAGRGGALLSEAGPDFKAVNLFADANVAAVGADRIALGGERGISLLERESRRALWGVKDTFPESLIIAGNAVIAGGNGDVRALALADGREMWRAAVPGRALGLAVAGGRLFVSNDRGQVVVFGK